MTAIEIYHKVAKAIPGSQESQFFGKPCYKIQGKAFCCFFQNEMVFKLSGEEHAEALNLEGSHLFDPSGKGRPMKAWVQVAAANESMWSAFARAAAKDQIA